VSFAFGVVGHRLRCSWCCRGNCYTLSSCEPFQFSDFAVEPKKYTVSCVVCRVSCVTCHWKRIFRRESTPRINNYTVRWRQKPYI
jgi:hypothetical protein